jgi:glutamyl-tRNA reductase
MRRRPPETEPLVDLANQGPPLVVVGTDFHLAPLELREQVALSAEACSLALQELLQDDNVQEAFVLSTCNRTEVYVQPRQPQEALRAVVERVFEARAPGIERQGRLAVRWNGEAAGHLLEVACGLESMVLGEPEILGQVKQSAALAEELGATGPVLGKLLRCAAGAGKRARSETDIAAGAVSYGYAAVELSRNIFSPFDRTRVLLLGAGDISRQVARSLLEKGVGSLIFANRHRDRAEALRDELGGGLVQDFEQRFEALKETDLVVVSTAAEEPVLDREAVAQALDKRRQQPLLLIDLSVPRNVAPEVRNLENVFLHDIDSLKHLVERNLRRRREEIPRVQEILRQELAFFFEWHRGKAAEPLVGQLQRHAENLRRQEVQTALGHFPPETHRALEQLTRSLVRKLLHHPSHRLRRLETEAEKLDFVRELFQLEPPDDPS